MNIIGLVGGLGPESTVAYYRQILALAQSRRPGSGAPAIVITSLDTKRVLALMADHDYDQAYEYLSAEVERLARAGCTVAVLTANTAHLLFERVAATSRLPLISIVTTARDAALKRGLKRVALIGTRYTMEAPLYPDVFVPSGISIVLPNSAEQALIHQRYLAELVPGVFRDETRAEFLRVIDRMIDEDQIDGVILGGTEIPLLLTDATYRGISFLDTTALHVAALVERL